MIERLSIELVTDAAPDGSAEATSGTVGLSLVARELPGVAVSWASRPASGALVIRAQEWQSPAFPAAFDELVGDATAAADAPVTLHLSSREAGPPLLAAASQILTRYQQLCRRRNERSGGARLDEILRLHRSLHDCSRPLVRADFTHALDTWRWVLRLRPRAGLALQLAALFHDVERLRSEAEVRVEQRARDYRSFKEAHAREGARLARVYLARSGLGASVLGRVAYLIAHHEAPNSDEEVQALNGADALSFLSWNSAGFMDYYGPEHTRKKLALTLSRLSPRARARLWMIRMRRDVERCVTAQARRRRWHGRGRHVLE